MEYKNKLMFFFQLVLLIVAAMLTMLSLVSTLPLSKEGNRHEEAELFLEKEQNGNIKEPIIKNVDDLETAQAIFRPLFVYRKLSAQRYSNARRTDNNVRRRRVSRLSYY